MKYFNKTLVAMSIALASFTLTGCIPSISSDTYSTSGAGQVNRTETGVIVNARMVTVSGDTLTQGGGMVGTLAGGAAGAIAGSTIGQGTGSALATIGGALIGGVAGNFAEKGLTKQSGMEYVVRTSDGKLVTIVQAAQPALTVGQQVYIEYGARARVVAAQYQ